MKSVSGYIRMAYKDALTDNLTYEDEPVKVYDAIPTNTTPKNYVVIRNVTDSSVNNDSKFISECSVELEIVSRQYKIQTNTPTEEILGLIYDIILINIGGDLESEHFGIGHMFVENARSLYEVDENGYYITRKIVTIRQLVVQNQ